MRAILKEEGEYVDAMATTAVQANAAKKTERT